MQKQRTVEPNGPTQDPMTQAGSELLHQPTEAHPSPSSHCCVEDYVALRLAKYDDEIPQIAQVIEVDELNVTVEWWIGTFHETWRQWKIKEEPVKETFPRNAVIYLVTFTKSTRFNSKLIAELKQIYQEIELI